MNKKIAEIEQDGAGHLTYDLSERRNKLLEKIKRGE